MCIDPSSADEPYQESTDACVHECTTSVVATCLDGQIPDGSMSLLTASNRMPLISSDVWVPVLTVGKMPEVGLEGLRLMARPLPDPTLGRTNSTLHVCGSDNGHGTTLPVK